MVKSDIVQSRGILSLGAKKLVITQKFNIHLPWWLSACNKATVYCSGRSILYTLLTKYFNRGVLIVIKPLAPSGYLKQRHILSEPQWFMFLPVQYCCSVQLSLGKISDAASIPEIPMNLLFTVQCWRRKVPWNVWTEMIKAGTETEPQKFLICISLTEKTIHSYNFTRI